MKILIDADADADGCPVVDIAFGQSYRKKTIYFWANWTIASDPLPKNVR